MVPQIQNTPSPSNVVVQPKPEPTVQVVPQPVPPPAQPSHVLLPNPSLHRFSAASPSSRSDSGTPTMDERYPDPVKMRRHKKRSDTSQSNSFFVFDPEKSKDCEEIRSYLASVQGVQFDVIKMYEKFCLNVDDRLKAGCTLHVAVQEEIRKVLPPGTLWVVFRTTDLKHLHSMKHLGLLKGAGVHVDFVSVDSVRDVQARQYRNILAGDGGILVPLCPKTLLKKPVVFRHLMLWLIGQTGDVAMNKNKWRMVLHQHLLDALQDAEKSEDAIERQNADQVLDLLCHASQSATKLAVELVEHQCDKLPFIEKTPSAWNWFDKATVEELSATALPCATKLQLDRIRKSKHVVLLIEDDPLAECWKPVWQSGVCVSTMDKFVDLICSKPSGSVAEQSTSSVLPLYGLAHKFL